MAGTAGSIDVSAETVRTVNAYREQFSGVTAAQTVGSLLNGGTLRSFTLAVKASVGESINIVDQAGTASTMRAGDVITFGVDESQDGLASGFSFALTNAADVVAINWTEVAP
jgi:hypothetical protein